MAVTPIFICGAECAVNFVGTTSPAVEHWSAIGTTAPTISTTTFNSAGGGVRSLRFNPSAQQCSASHTFETAIASPATMVARFYLYFASLPTADHQICVAAPTSLGLWFDQSAGTVCAGESGVVSTAGISVTTGQWYRIDLKVVRDATRTVDFQVNGVAGTQYSVASGAGTITGVTFGQSGTNQTADFFVDDICVSGTSGEYPIGASGVVGLYPSGDTSHFYSAAGDFLDGGTAQATLNADPSLETDTWLSLRSKADGGLSGTVDNANFVTNATGGVSEWLRWNFENMPADASTVNGVASVSTHHAASATGNTQAMKLINGSDLAEISVLGTFSGGPPANTAATGVDLSDTTIICVYKCAATGETLGAWTVAGVNALRGHWSSTDVNPDAYLDGWCLEVSVTFTTFDGGPHVIVAPSQASQTASRW